MSKSPFKPAPRPRAVDPEADSRTREAAAALTRETADMGFGRPIHSANRPAEQEPVSPPEQAAERPPEQEGASPLEQEAKSPPEQAPNNPPVRTGRRTRGRAADRAQVQEAKSTLAPQRTLKMDVDNDLWILLRTRAAQRGVTIKFLLLEALAKADYPIDMAAVQEDGRRVR